MGSREEILKAAAAMFGEDAGARLSVRAVAARAGVSTGSLRHHFPTQRALQDAVLSLVYDRAMPDDHIHDRSVPARERLVECLRRVLAPAGIGTQSREAWGRVYHSLIAVEPTASVREAYLAIEREARRRVEYWLTVLAEEGEVDRADIDRLTTFLLTVVNGLSIERALPVTVESVLANETSTLYTAADTVLTRPDR